MRRSWEENRGGSVGVDMTLGEALFEIADAVAAIVLMVGDDDCDSDDDGVIPPIVVCFEKSEIMQQCSSFYSHYY